MKNSSKKVIAAAVIVLVVLVAFLLSLRGVEDFHDKYAGVDLTTDVAGMEREGTYAGYLKAHSGAKNAASSVEVDLFSGTFEGDVQTMDTYQGESNVLLTGSGSRAEWTVDVPETGFYNLYMEYLIPESRGVAAERAVYVNGEIPFEAANNISFTRIWKDGGDVRVDNQDNEIRPTQVEVFDWQHTYFRDDRG